MKKFNYLILPLLLIVSACDPDDDDNNNNILDYFLGWIGSDDPGTVPVSVNAATFTGDPGSLPASVDLVPKFPPIGDQGQFGTCVSWATAYNYKTAIEGMDKGYNSSQLASASNQLSPKDLFTAIPDNKKGQNCNGTNFTDALDVVLARGVATQQTVPYTNLNGCSQSNVQSAWTNEAAGHKIANYRRIAVDKNTWKSYLSNNTPIIFGARLGDNFMQWNSDEVITGHSGFDNVGIHAYHAMVCAGYDDSKGPNGAFKVINSWGQNWGSAGYIWVDYNFMMSDFCFGGNSYIASNAGGTNPPDNVDPTVNGSVDLATWAFADYSTTSQTGFTNTRDIEYNLYNIGDQAATPQMDHTLYYIYYNAYDANDWGILFYDEFNTTIPANTYDCPTADHCIINATIPSGDDMANVMFGQSSLIQSYVVPTSVTGYYYLLLLADGEDVIGEQDEQNNYFYTTSQYPVYFDQGYAPRLNGKPTELLSKYKFNNPGIPNRWEVKASKFHSAVSEHYPNAYSVKEIRAFLKQEKKNGNFQRKVDEFRMRAKPIDTSLRAK